MTPPRADAWQLLTEWTTGESLRKHALAVEAAVRGYARMAGADDEEWGLVALLHDFDYERYPTAADHPFRGCEELQRRGYPEWVMKAILSHANYSGVPRETPCAVVSRASAPAQQTTVTALEKLPSVSAQAKPSILILGDVVRLAKLGQLDFQTLSAELLPAQNSDQREEANRA